MNRPAHPLRTFLTGALALLPLAATVALVVWALRLLSQWLGPGSWLGGWLTRIGLGVTESEWVGYLIGLLLVLLVVYATGLLVELGFERGLRRGVDALVRRIPIVRNVYDLLHRMVGLMAQGGGEGELRSMTPVWVHFGGRGAGVTNPVQGGAAAVTRSASTVLAFQATPQPVMVAGQPRIGVLLPTAPVPIGGALLYVPPDWVEPADIGLDGATSLYVSMGVTSAQVLGVSTGAAAATPAAAGSGRGTDQAAPRPR